LRLSSSWAKAELVAEDGLLGGLGVTLGQHLQTGGYLDVAGPVAHLDGMPDDEQGRRDTRDDQQGQYHHRVALFRRQSIQHRQAPLEVQRPSSDP
jgi:hypothetical protein